MELNQNAAQAEVNENEIQQELLDAVKEGDFEEASEILETNRSLITKATHLLSDLACRTAAHYAADSSTEEAEGFLLLLMKATDGQCLRDKDADGATPLHLSAKKQTTETVLKLIDRVGDESATRWRMKNGDTVAHCAARNDRDGLLLRLVVRFGKSCLTVENAKSVTCLHLAAKHLKYEEFDAMLRKTRNQGDTVLHFAAQNTEHPETFIRLMARYEFGNLSKTDDSGRTPLHYGVLCQSKETIQEVLKLKNFFSQNDLHQPPADIEGNRLAHLAAQNRNYPDVFKMVLMKFGFASAIAVNELEQTPLHLAAQSKLLEPVLLNEILAQIEKGAKEVLNLKDKNERNVIFYACLGHNFDILISDQQHDQQHDQQYDQQHDHDLSVEPQDFHLSDLMCTDSQGNTLLHALFKKYSVLNDFNLDEWKKAFIALLNAGCDLKAENHNGQTCLQASELQAEDLKSIIDDTDLKETLESVMVNSHGEHAIHIFSGRYHIGQLLPKLAYCCDESEETLVNLRVESGFMKGATCLHFACATGQTESVKFLMKRGLKLKDLGCPGRRSCIDVACDRGKLHTLSHFVMEDFETCLCLIDRVSRALPTNYKSRAKKVLSAYTDRIVEENMTPENVAELQIAQSRPGMVCLLRALELDSTEILRSGLSQNMLDNADVDKFPRFFAREITSNSQLDLPRKSDFTSRFSFDKILQMTAIEIAVQFEKYQLACELILIEPVNLIPRAILTLILLQKRLRKSNERQTQIHRLQEQTTNIVTNALDELYLNASYEPRPDGQESDQALLFSYLKGEFESGPRWKLPITFNNNNNNNNNNENAPRRPQVVSEGGSVRSPGSQPAPSTTEPPASKQQGITLQSEQFTVLQLIEHLGGHDLCATECVHSLTNKEWKAPDFTFPHLSSEKSVFGSPRYKFGIHLFAQVVFLILFAWFVTDFKLALLNPWSVAPIVCYAFSFFTQELREFIRLRQCEALSFWPSLKVPVYLKDVLNLVDLTAFLFMLAGIVWFFQICGDEHSTSYGCQMTFTTSFLLWGFRSISFLSYNETIGPLITVLRLLLVQDLLPFLSILFVIFYSFGVFFFNLLFPVVTASTAETSSPYYGWNVVKQMFAFPFLLMFGLYERGDLLTATNKTDQFIGDTAHLEGFNWLWNVLMFVFLMLVNIVMVNLLIALFNLTVISVVGKAKAIWRKKLFDMQIEFKNASVLPPPLSFFYDIAWLIRKVRNVRKVNENSYSNWKNDLPSSWPDNYKKFLLYQAKQMRKSRATLNRPMERSKDEVEKLRAATEKSLLELETRLNERIDDLRRRVKRRNHASPMHHHASPSPTTMTRF